MQTVLDILERIEPLASADGYDAMKRFLMHPATHFHQSESYGRVTVDAINHAWATRLEMALKKGFEPLPGCKCLVQSLARFPAAAMLNMVVLEGDDQLGAVWFLEATSEPVGFVLGDRAVAMRPAAAKSQDRRSNRGRSEMQ